MSESPTSPAAGVRFRVDPRRTLGYRLARLIVTVAVRSWFRPRIQGRANVPAAGPVILAPVHRSFADFVFSALLTDRKLFFMAKDSLWASPALGRLLVALGCFPVHREGADREALRRAEEVLRQGQVLVVFPEGTRKEGPEVAPLHDGVAFLAARTGAPIVPMGIGGSDRAMPKGTKIPKPLRIDLVVGPALPAPETTSRRVTRGQLDQATAALHQAVQEVYDRARAAQGAGI